MASLDYLTGYYARPPALEIVRSTGPFRPAIGVTPPVLLFRKDPEYSEAARKAKYSGTVILSIELDASGRVTDSRVVRGLGLGLDEKAIEAVRQWRFKSGTKDGRPVGTTPQVEMEFRLL